MASDGGHDRYELVERIAVGGMAEVFLAKTHGSHGFEKTLAIKRILPDLASAPEFERRFIAEAKIAVTLNHANIVQVLDFSKFGDSLYIAMEFVDGMDVSALLEGQRELPLPAALHLAMEMLKGLDFAHRRGVVHRDVSPSNVLVSRAGEVKIADFGIAQAANAGVDVTRTRRIMGKWRYMSPEQTRGDELDARSDLFSAGSVIYEVLTGKKLFTGNDAETIVRNITDKKIPSVTEARPTLPAALDDVLAGMLHRDRKKRTARAAEALSALVDISYQRSVQATAMNLADVVADVMPESRDTEDSEVSARLIDDIINSELESEGAPKSKRRTMADGRMPDFAPEDLGEGVPGLTFVDSGTNAQGITKWIVEPTVVKPLPKGKTLPLGLIGAVVDETQPPSPADDGVEDFAEDEDETIRRGTELYREPSKSYIAPRRRSSGLVWILLGAIAIGGGVGVALYLSVDDNRAAAPVAIDAAITAPPVDAGAPEPIAVNVTSTPQGASIRIGGVDTGKVTPANIELLDPGEPVELVLDGYEPCRLGFDGDTDMTCALERVGARLTVTTKPAGATVRLDGKKLGKTPIADLSVPAKAERATLKIELDGHKDQSRKVRLIAGKSLEVDVKLVEKTKFGTIDIYAEPWAHVYLRGKKIGTAPQRRLKLPVGRHRLKLSNPVQKRSTTITVTVPSSKPYRVKLPAAK